MRGADTSPALHGDSTRAPESLSTWIRCLVVISKIVLSRFFTSLFGVILRSCLGFLSRVPYLLMLFNYSFFRGKFVVEIEVS